MKHIVVITLEVECHEQDEHYQIATAKLVALFTLVNKYLVDRLKTFYQKVEHVKLNMSVGAGIQSGF